jgi:hypothetical protein
MADDVKKFIQSCDACQRTKSANSLPFGLLHALPVPEDRFESVNIDFADMPMSANGYDYIMIIKDRFSRLLELIPCHRKLTADDAAQLLYRCWYLKGFGFPSEIVSDRDTKFISKFWTTFCTKTGINIAMSTARHQQTDGGAEIMIRLLKESLKRVSNFRQDDWDTHLSAIQFAHNNSTNSTTGFTPFYLAFAFQPQTFPAFTNKDSLLSTFNTHRKNLELAHQHIFDSQTQMKATYDARHDPAPQFLVGQMVLLHRNGVRWPPSYNVSAKLLQPYLGPFKITHVDEELDNVTLELPPGMRCYNTFHVSKIKPWIKADTDFPTRAAAYNPPPELDEDDEEAFEVDEILDTRVYGRWKKRQFLVRWLGYDSSHDQWEPLDHLLHCPEKLSDYLKKHPIPHFSLDTALKDAGGV